MWLTLPSLALLAITAVATPLQSRHLAVKETHPVPHGFTRERDAPGHHLLRIQVGINQGRFDELEKHLYESRSRNLARLILVLTDPCQYLTLTMLDTDST